MKAEYADESCLGFFQIVENVKGEGSTHSWDHLNHLGGK
jgi:hypothetical protein